MTFKDTLNTKHVVTTKQLFTTLFCSGFTTISLIAAITFKLNHFYISAYVTLGIYFVFLFTVFYTHAKMFKQEVKTNEN